jgi:zinc protease
MARISKYIFVKKISVLILLLWVPALVNPVLGEAPIQEFNINGIKVLYKPSVKEIISVRLFIVGGVANYSKGKEGIENLALLTAIQGGTTKMDKIAFHTEAEKIGARFSAGSTYDYGHISMTCLKEYWDSSWKLLQDAILNPAFKESEFNLVKEQSFSAAQQTQSDPDAHLRNLSLSNAFRNDHYEKIPEGSPESLDKMNVAEVRDYYANLIKKDKVFLVIVGNVDINDLKKKISASLGKLKNDKTKAKAEPVISSLDTEPLVEERDIATNYIRGIMHAPTMDNVEGVPMRIAMSVLSDRYFVELRTKRSLSYAPAAFYSTGVLKKPYNVIYISTQDPKTSIEVMVEEINKIQKEGFQERELVNKKLSFLTNYYLGLETNSSQSLAIGHAELSKSRRIFENFDHIIEGISLDMINEVFRKYTNVIDWTYLGKDDGNLADIFLQPRK